MNHLFELRNLEFSYAGTPLFEKLNLCSQAGCCTTILGPNGCGKSTLLRLLAGRLLPKNGEIMLFNKKLSDYSCHELAVTIGFLPQKSPLLTGISVLELLYCARYPYRESSAASRAKIQEALNLTEVPEKLWNSGLNNLSGGELQRVMLAFVLAKNPAVLLLDEPTSGLDLRGKQDFLNLIGKLKQEKQLSIICVLHELNVAASISDKIWLMSKESGTLSGTPEEILTGENLSRVYRVKMDECFDVRNLPRYN